MSSNTTPQGECFGSPIHTTGLDWYKAFDNDTSARCLLAFGTGQYLGYKFTSSVKIYCSEMYNSVSTSQEFNEYKIQGSNDNFISDIHDLGTNNYSTVGVVQKTPLNNVDDYQYYRFLSTSTNSQVRDVHEAQFYGREAGGVQTLLKLAGVTGKLYTTVDELLADHSALAQVIASHDAIDYLVTAKSFITAFTSDATAMRYIGKRNYAANTLLGDADWCEGIAGSEYVESVLNVKVPQMTSNTAPYGEAFASSLEQSEPWWAFNNSKSGVVNDRTALAPYYVGYKFTSDTKIYRVDLKLVRAGTTSGQTLAFSFDKYVGGSWVSFDTYTAAGLNTDNPLSFTVLTDSGNAASDYRVSTTNPWFGGTLSKYLAVQFYGREDVVESDIDIYSAAYDTITITPQGGGTAIPVVTDETGHAGVSRATLPAGTYTFTSSVAKDPDNLSNYYSKQITVTNDTVLIEFMPDNALYWYGYSNNLETISASNGWTNPSGATDTPTNDSATYYYEATTNSSQISGKGNTKAVTGAKVCCIAQGVTASGSSYGKICYMETKAIAWTNQSLFDSDQLKKYEYVITVNGYIFVGSNASRSVKVYAIWLE